MSYVVQNGLDLAKKLGKGVPFTSVDATICDIVSSTIYRSYPWRSVLRNFPAVPLTDNNQDFSTGLSELFRVTQFWITRTDATPNKALDLTVAKNLFVDLLPKSPTQIRSASYQAGVDKFRLESAIRIPQNSSWTLNGEYQPQHTKISDLQDPLWFTDQFLEVFAKGLIYWAYRLADDARAGAAQYSEGRPPVYTGALAEFMSSIHEMAAQEDFGNIDGYYPSDSLGAVDGRRGYSNDVYPLIF